MLSWSWKPRWVADAPYCFEIFLPGKPKIEILLPGKPKIEILLSSQPKIICPLQTPATAFWVYCGTYTAVQLPQNFRLHTSVACQKLQEGDSASLSRTITKEEVLQYAELTGDFNPVHLGDDKSDGVVHGALLLGLVSGLVASRLPGPGTQLAGIQARFPRPCAVGTGVIVTVTLGKVRKLTPVRFTVVDFWSRSFYLWNSFLIYFS